MLHFTSRWLFCNYHFLLLSPFSSFTHPPNPAPMWQPSEHSAYLWVCFLLVHLFYFLDSISKWNHTAFVLLRHFTQHVPCRSIHVVVDDKISFFVVAESYYIVYVHHFFIHSSACYFHVLAIVSSAAVNTWMPMFFSLGFWFFSDKYPEV